MAREMPKPSWFWWPLLALATPVFAAEWVIRKVSNAS